MLFVLFISLDFLPEIQVESFSSFYSFGNVSELKFVARLDDLSCRRCRIKVQTDLDGCGAVALSKGKAL